MVRPIDTNGYIQHPPRVHFSPIVSQLRYHQQQGVPSKKPTSVKNQHNYTNHYRDQPNANPRVTVQVQEVIVPPLPPVQKVQVTVPLPQASSTTSTRNRYALEVNVPQSASSTSTTRAQMMDYPHENLNRLRGDDEHVYGQNNKPAYYCTHTCGISPCAQFSPGPPALNQKESKYYYSIKNCDSEPNGYFTNLKNSLNGSKTTTNNSKGNNVNNKSNTTSNTSTIDSITPCDAANCRATIIKSNPHKSDYGYEYYGYGYGLPASSSWDHQPWVPVPNSLSAAPYLESQSCSSHYKSNNIHSNDINGICQGRQKKRPTFLNGFLDQAITTTNSSNSLLLNSSDYSHSRRPQIRGQSPAEVNYFAPLLDEKFAPRFNSDVAHYAYSSHNDHSITVTETNDEGRQVDSRAVVSNKNWLKRSREDKKVKKTKSVKSSNNNSGNNNKLSFLHRFTLGRLVKQSKSNKKSLSSSSATSTAQVVPVSTWPVKSITGVVVLESTESPVSSSCSTCGELWEGKKKKGKARHPVILGRDHSLGTTGAGREDSRGISHNSRQSKAPNGLSVNLPYHCTNIRGRDSIECISLEDEKYRGETGIGRSSCRSSVAAGKPNDILVSSDIPGTDTWDPQTADQTHLGKVGKERAAAEPISNVESLSSVTNYQGDCQWRVGEGYETRKLGLENANKSIVKWNNVGSNFANKNVATSPIHHLSAFYALNLPIVPGKSHSSVITEEEEELRPVPKPRLKRLRKSSVEEKTSCETDELSANVDRILDEIAGLELECMRMERKGKLLDEQDGNYLHDGDNKENEERFAKSQSSTWETERLRMGLHNHQRRSPEKVGLVGKPPLPPSTRSMAASRQDFFNSNPSGGSRLFEKPGMSGTDLGVKLLKFQVQLYRSREELAKSHPNLEEIEDTVRSSMAIDRSSRQRTLPLSLCRGSENPEISPGYTTTHVSGQIHRHTPDPVTIEKERYRARVWSNLCSKVNQNFLRSPPSNNNRHGNTSGPLHFTGIVETDLDTGASREILGGDEQLYFESYGQQQEWTTNDQGNCSGDSVKSKNLPLSIFPDDGRLSYSLNQKTQSMLNLGSPTSTMSHKGKSATIASTSSAKGADSGTLSVASTSADERARSMEFLMEDSDKNAHLRPPENNLMRQENRQLSEHELRIQRSLNKLNVPDWYKKYSTGETEGGAASAGGSAAGSKAKLFGSGSGLAGGWSGLSTSKTSSLTSLQSTGRTHFSRLRSTGTASSGARSSRESLMSPSSTASASPSPYYERSSFTYGMPYALTRFASARMSCGASPASLSPSPSPVGGVGGSSISTPVSSAPLSRHHSYSKAPYLGWRSQERLTSKSMYRSPAERLAQDLLAQKSKTSATSSTASTPQEGNKETPEIHLEVSPKKETVSASDLSLNNSEESNSHKLNRVRSSIKEVSNAIVDYVNESKPLDDGINGGTSPRKGFVWLESSFVGTKPIDSPGTPDTPAMFMTANRQLPAHESGSSSSIGRPRHVFRFDDEHSSSFRETTGFTKTSTPQASKNDSAVANTNNGSNYSTPYHSRNEQMEERSNSSSVSSPTLEDILDSLLALRRPHKKIRARSGKGHTREPAPIPPPHLDPTPVSDWQERMNQPVLDTAYFPINDDFFAATAVTATTVTTSNITSANNYSSDSYNINSLSGYNNNVTTNEDNVGGEGGHDDPVETYNYTTNVMYTGSNGDRMESITTIRGTKVPEPVSVTDYSVVVELGRADQLLQGGGEDVVDKEEDSFGIPTEICTATSSASAANAMASLNDSNPPTPARHRRVSFDLDISDKEEKSSSRSNRRDESVGGTIHCRNSKCAKSASGLEARREFKTCHNCNAYYCSRECRRAHWDKHKKVCMQSRVGALCKQIINHVKEDSFVVSQLSGVARRGFLAKGRGCVKLFFSSPDRAERFLTGGLPELPEPWYIPCGDILPEEMGAQTFSELSEQCRTYNGDNRFVLYVSVCVVNEVPTSGAVKWEREMISRSSKLRLLLPRNYEETQMHHQAASPAHLFPEEPHVPVYHHEADSNPGAQGNLPPLSPPNGSESETLILRSVPAPTSHQLSRSDHKKLREVSFANIQKHLLERGVDLRRTYPDIYSKLCTYVEHDEPFLPVTIYPKNSNTGGQFVCVIMPESSDSTLEDYTMSDKVKTVNISESSYDIC